MLPEKLPLRQRKAEQTRHRIINAALQLFYKSGYEQVTMDAIAEEAEIGRATLFNYFPSKAALLIPISQQIIFAELYPPLETYLSQRPSTLDALRYYFTLLAERINELPDVARAILSVLELTKADSAKQVPEFLDALRLILVYGQGRQEVRKDLPLDVLVQYLAMLYGLCIVQIVAQDDMAAYNDAMQLLLRFIATGLTIPS
jgi:AcrR family transcriptional regulator